MKKIIARTAALLAAALVLASLAACANTANRPERLIAGKWQASVARLDFDAMEFVPDADNPLSGKVNMSMKLLARLVDGSYVITPADTKDGPDRLKITYTLAVLTTTQEYTFTVDEETLQLHNERTTLDMTFKRAQPAGTTAPA